MLIDHVGSLLVLPPQLWEPSGAHNPPETLVPVNPLYKIVVFWVLKLWKCPCSNFRWLSIYKSKRILKKENHWNNFWFTWSYLCSSLLRQSLPTILHSFIFRVFCVSIIPSLFLHHFNFLLILNIFWLWWASMFDIMWLICFFFLVEITLENFIKVDFFFNFILF